MTAKPLNKKWILIVEDEQPFQEIYRDILESEGYQVAIADDGDAALQWLEQNTPDLVLLDIILPKQSGFDILRHIRAVVATKDTPVLVYSVINDQEHIDKALNLGANDFAIKGQTPAYEVLEKVNALLGSPPLLKE